jgi:hypothetical protein
VKTPKPKYTVVMRWCILTLLLTNILSCTREKILPKQLTASFQIKEVIWNPKFWDKETYDTDSVFTAETEFFANEPEDSNILYQWKIGTDSRVFTTRKFSLRFTSLTPDGIIVTLSVLKKNMSGTIIEQKTSSRTFYLVGGSQVEGHFQGYFEGISQKADVYIKSNDFSNSEFFNEKGVMITSSVQKFDSLFSPDGWNEHFVLNRRIYFDWANTISEVINNRIRFPHGSINLDKDYKTLTIDLTVREVSTGRDIPMKFKGTKI